MTEDMTGLGSDTLRLFAALVAGGLIGLNRDIYGKPTGVRVHALVALGCALITLVGVALGSSADTSRVVQGVVGGIGFLGAGVIMHESRTLRALHLTTAASIWVTAALGIACGTGTWRLVALGAVATLLVLTLGRIPDRKLRGILGPDEDDIAPPPGGVG